MNCMCGKELEFHDNSIPTENGKYGDVYPIYYCRDCDKVYDAWELDCEEEYKGVLKKFIKWFKR